MQKKLEKSESPDIYELGYWPEIVGVVLSAAIIFYLFAMAA